MNGWLEPFIAGLAGLLGACVGTTSSKLPRQWWLAVFVPSFLVIMLVTAFARWPALGADSLLGTLFSSEWRFVLMGFVAAVLLSTPFARMPKRKYRMAVGVFSAAIVWHMSVWPCLAAASSRSQLDAVRTQIDRDGVCLQSTEYTCGPASAVTALRRLGLTAEEGELALLARSSKVTGTPADVLAAVINERFGHDRIEAQYREFRDLDDLRTAGLSLIVVKHGLLMDHWMTVLDVNDHEVVVGNPLSGVEHLSREQFLARWRHIGVTVRRHG